MDFNIKEPISLYIVYEIIDYNGNEEVKFFFLKLEEAEDYAYKDPLLRTVRRIEKYNKDLK